MVARRTLRDRKVLHDADVLCVRTVAAMEETVVAAVFVGVAERDFVAESEPPITNTSVLVVGSALIGAGS